MINVWMFYIPVKRYIFNAYQSNSNRLPVTKTEKPYYLYAWTKKKKISKLFMSIRNMKLFVMKKISIDDDEFELLCSSKNIYDLEIGLCSFSMCDLLITTMEYDILIDWSGDIIMDMIEDIEISNPLRFKSKYQKALIDIGFDSISSLQENDVEDIYNLENIFNTLFRELLK